MKVRELLRPETWIQGHAATNVEGIAVDPESGEAVFFCLIGAVTRCYREDVEMRDSVMRELFARVKQKTGMGLIAFNDYPHRQFAEVKAVVEELDI